MGKKKDKKKKNLKKGIEKKLVEAKKMIEREKNKKPVSYKLIDKNIKCLKKGRVKVDKNTSYDIDDMIKNSIRDSVVLDVNSIIARNPLDTETNAVVASYSITQYEGIEKFIENRTGVIPTVLINLPRKCAESAFDYTNRHVLGDILRTSTLPAVYSMIKPKWLSLVHDGAVDVTKVIFVPNVSIFLDIRTGKALTSPYFINVLIVVGAEFDEIREYSVDDPDKVLYEGDVAHVRHIILENLGTLHELGCKNVIIDPLDLKIFRENSYEVGKAYADEKIFDKTTFNSVVFTVEDTDKMISLMNVMYPDTKIETESEIETAL